MLKKILLGAGFAGLTFLSHTAARAHIGNYSGEGKSSCSPHYAGGSKGGTVFSNCYKTQGSDAKGTYYHFNRNITCAVGTGCANALCGSGKKVSGGSADSYARTYNFNVKHTVTVHSVTCQ